MHMRQLWKTARFVLVAAAIAFAGCENEPPHSPPAADLTDGGNVPLASPLDASDDAGLLRADAQPAALKLDSPPSSPPAPPPSPPAPPLSPPAGRDAIDTAIDAAIVPNVVTPVSGQTDSLNQNDQAALSGIDLDAINPLELQAFLEHFFDTGSAIPRLQIGHVGKAKVASEASQTRLLTRISGTENPPHFLKAMKTVEQKRAFARLIVFFLQHSNDRESTLMACRCMGLRNIAQQFIDVIIVTTKQFKSGSELDYIGFASGRLLHDYTMASALLALGYRIQALSFIDNTYDQSDRNQRLRKRFNTLLSADHPRGAGSLLDTIHLYGSVDAFAHAAPPIGKQVLLTCTDPGDLPDFEKADQHFIALRKHILATGSPKLISSAMWWDIGKWWDGEPARPPQGQLFDIALDVFEGEVEIYRRIHMLGQ